MPPDLPEDDEGPMKFVAGWWLKNLQTQLATQLSLFEYICSCWERECGCFNLFRGRGAGLVVVVVTLLLVLLLLLCVRAGATISN